MKNEDGEQIIELKRNDGTIFCRYYAKNGKYHRVDGPAIQFFNSENRLYPEYTEDQFWINGIRLRNVKTTEELVIKLLLE